MSDPQTWNKVCLILEIKHRVLTGITPGCSYTGEGGENVKNGELYYSNIF